MAPTLDWFPSGPRRVAAGLRRPGVRGSRRSTRTSTRRRHRRRWSRPCEPGCPAAAWAMVKLNEGASGAGNALVGLARLPAVGAGEERDGSRLRVLEHSPRLTASSVDHYLDGLRPTQAASWRSGSAVTSWGARACRWGSLPARQRRDPLDPRPAPGWARAASATSVARSVRPRLFGGRSPSPPRRSGQTSGRPGCARSLRPRLRCRPRRFTSLGAACHRAEPPQGGTTHPFLTLQFLTDGAYDCDAGRFFRPGPGQRPDLWRPTTWRTKG